MDSHLYSIGDLHFGLTRDWDAESFTHFLVWFKSLDFPPGSELLQLGDITEKGQLTGEALYMVTEFFSIALCKFDKIYVIGGNHCHKYVNGKSEYVAEFLPLISDRIKVFTKEAVFYALGDKIKIMALPYQHTAESIEEYYNKLPDDFCSQHVDLLCGHLQIFDLNKPYIEGVDLSRFNYDYIAFGHIHSRFGDIGLNYTGSIMPFRKSEESTEHPRIIKCLDFKNDKLEEGEDILIPQFRHYEVIDFNTQKPEHKKNSGDVVYIYELENCYSESLAHTMYADYYIKFGKRLKQEFATEDQQNLKFFENNIDALNKMLEANQDIKLKRKSQILLRQLLAE